MSFFGFFTEDLVSRAEAFQILAPFRSDFCYAVNSAWDEWKNDIPESSRNKIDAKCRGGIVNNFAKHYARKVFRDREDKGVRICNDLGFLKIYFGNNRVVIRFKKLRNDHTVNLSGAKQQAIDWFKHAPLKGVPRDSTRLTVGYILNPIETEIEEIAISSQIGDKLHYSFCIHEEASTMSLPSNKNFNEELPSARIFPAGHDKSVAEDA